MKIDLGIISDILGYLVFNKDAALWKCIGIIFRIMFKSYKVYMASSLWSIVKNLLLSGFYFSMLFVCFSLCTYQVFPSI